MSAHLSDEILAAHLDGTLSPTEREAADAHLEVCARCREERELAGLGRDALRALSRELRPPVDIAAAVAREIEGPPVVGAPNGAPRWYRAAGIVAAAAAIALLAVVVPNLGGRAPEERSGAAAEASGPAAAEAIGGQDAAASASETFSAASRVALESAARELDDDDLSLLLTDPERLTFSQGSSPAATESTDTGDALACLVTAAGRAALSETVPTRVIEANYRGQPALIGLYTSTSDDAGTLLTVAARQGCRLLASGSSATGTVTPSE